MAHKKTIAIIGATEEIGAAIAKCLSRLEYRLLLMSNDTDKLNTLCTALQQPEAKAEIEGVNCSKEASWEADIIFLATPYEAGKAVAERIREVVIGKIVISISQPIHGKINTSVQEINSSAAEDLQRQLLHSKVVKTFNTMYGLDNYSPSSNTKIPDTFIAGNNGEAVEIVSELMASAGFNPIPIGDLSMSRTMERMQAKLIQENIKTNPNWLAGWKMYTS